MTKLAKEMLNGNLVQESSLPVILSVSIYGSYYKNTIDENKITWRSSWSIYQNKSCYASGLNAFKRNFNFLYDEDWQT